MALNSGAVLNLRGDPEPPSAVVTRLAALGMAIKWSGFNQWAVIREWKESDRRWAWVASGAMPREAAHDILGYVPNACSVDEVPAYVERLVRDWPSEHRDRTLREIADYNKRPDEQVAVVEEATAEVIEEVTAPFVKKGRRARVIPSSTEG